MSNDSHSVVGEGIITKRSPGSVDDTLARLRALLAAKDLAIFSVVDHSGEAEKVGLTMPDTKLVIFGSPAAGTPVMLASPLVALDLPLKVLIWEDQDGTTFVSYNAPAYLADRYQLSDKLATNLAGIDGIVGVLVGQ